MALGSDITITTVGDWVKFAVSSYALTVALRREDIAQPYIFNGIVNIPLKEMIPEAGSRITYDVTAQSMTVNGSTYAINALDPETALNLILGVLRNTSYYVAST